MIKKLIALCLAVLFCMGLTVSVSADAAVTYIIDETGGYLTESELESLNTYAAEMQDLHDAGIFYVYTTEQELKEYDVDSLVGDMENYFVMLENNTSWYVISSGSCSGFTPEVEDEIRAAYDAEATYVGGIEAYLETTAQRVPYIEDTPEGDIPES